MSKKLGKAEQDRLFSWGYHLAFETSSKRKNWRNIFASWRAAAESGHKRAQFYLGTCYDNGLGVDKDIPEAFKWYMKAARQGHPDSQYNIACFYDKGEVVKQNDRQAAKWYILAAEQGDIGSQRNLGVRYIYGNGVK
ncbi:MAG TPA: tetratricopeptide repeat protein, partial [Chitinophaga sp.]